MNRLQLTKQQTKGSSMIDNALAKLSNANQMLARADTPQQTMEVEAMASAARAWAKERDDYELLVTSMRVWIMARRKTTELIKPSIQQGGHNKKQPNNDVKLLGDFGFTYMQWNRRVKELSISEDEIDAYFDECIANGWEPTSFGLKLWQDGAHVSHNSGNNEWYTPSEYIEAAREVLEEIDLDPASSATANKIVMARRFYSEENDGLTKKWNGRVWMNPPYSSELIGQFTEKLCEHVRLGDISEAIVLVNNATEAAWFEDMAELAATVMFTFSRVKFLDNDLNPRGAPLQGQALLYFGPNHKKFIKAFSKLAWAVNYGKR